MKELLREVFAVMRNNKTRLMLTGFAMGWGLFILMVMIGSGNGVTRGVAASFGTDTICTLYLTPGKTSMAWKGYNPQREIPLHADDADAILHSFGKEIRSLSIQSTSPSIEVSANAHSITTSITGCQMGDFVYDIFTITKGRDFTPVDMERHSLVCLIGQQTADILFGKDSCPLGCSIMAGGTCFKIVGIYDSPFGYGSGHIIYAPYTTCMDYFVVDKKLSKIIVVADDVSNMVEFDAFKDRIYSFMAERQDFNPKDKFAINCNSYTDQYFQLKTVLDMISLFIWIVGLATLISGVVGISNIMIIGIKERTREFGIRLAMGASDHSIIALVLTESVIISVIFGYIGMMLGVGLTQLIAFALESVGDVPYFKNPTVDFWVLIVSLFIMVMAGLLAGFFPARQAVRLKLVDALNS